MILQRDTTKEICIVYIISSSKFSRGMHLIFAYLQTMLCWIYMSSFISLSLQSSAVTSRFMAYRLLNLVSTLFYPRPFLSAVHKFHLPQYHVTNLCYSYGAPLVPVQQIFLSGGHQITIWWAPDKMWWPPDDYLVATR